MSRRGALLAWATVVALSLLAGEMSAISFGGQNGRLLWVDVVLAGGLLLALLLGGGRFVLPSAPFLGWTAAFLAVAGVGLVFSRDLLTGVAELKEWGFALLAGILAARASGDVRGARAIFGAVAATGAAIALAMAVVAAQSPLGPVLAVLTKTVDLPWGRSNYLAGLLAVALPLALALVVTARGAGRLAWGAATVAIALGLVLSASKGALLACVAGFALALVGAGRAGRPWRVLGFGLLALGVLAFAASPLREVAAYRLLPSALDFSAGERMRLYTLALEQFAQHPLLGVGLNNFSVVAHRLRGVDTVPHNFTLGFLAETGLVGAGVVTAWAVALAAALRAPWRAARAAGDARLEALALGPWAVFLVALVHNQFESTLYGEQFKVLLFLVAGAAWGLARATPPARGVAG